MTQKLHSQTLSSLGACILLAITPACMEPSPDEDFDQLRANEMPELLVEVDHCPDEYFEAAAESEGRYQFICGLVVDREGNPIEAGVEVRINGERVSDGAEFDWWHERDLESQPSVLLDISAPGYLPLVSRVPGSWINRPIVLESLNLAEFHPEQGAEVVDPSGAAVIIPPNAFEIVGGDEPEGHVLLGTLSLEALPGDMTALPGDMTAITTLFTSARDQAGNALQLRPGVSIDMFVPLDKRIPDLLERESGLWRFHRESGLWNTLEGSEYFFEGVRSEGLGFVSFGVAMNQD